MLRSSPSQVMRFDEKLFSPRFEHGDMADVVEVTGSALGTSLGTGFARFADASIPWTVQYDEVIFVLEGQLAIETAAHELIAELGDCI